MKNIYSILAAALLTTGALLTTACSGDDDAVIDNITPTTGAETIQFTATLAPMGDGTRAITDDNGTTMWKKDEQIAIYYETTDGHAMATAIVGEPNPDGSAPITATLTDAKDNGDAKFVYPASLANTTGDIDESILLTQQKGTLRMGSKSISNYFDAATATGKISVSDGTASVKGTVAMKNQVCICKIKLTVYTIGQNGTLVKLYTPLDNNLTINDGNGHVYTITSENDWGSGILSPDAPPYRGFQTDDEIYVAMLPITDKPLTISATRTLTSVTNNYTITTKPGTLTAGKFYRNVPISIYIDPITITGDITHTFIVPDGLTVTLNGANFTVIDAPAIQLGDNSTLIFKGTNSIAAKSAPAIQCDGNASIVVESNTNNINAMSTGQSGISIADGKTLDIQGTGSATFRGGIAIPNGSTLELGGNAVNRDIFIPDGASVSTNGVSVSSTINLPDGANVTLCQMTVNVNSGPAIFCKGDATIILDGTNSVTTTHSGAPGILPGPTGKTLTIMGNGSLTAMGGSSTMENYSGAGIGSGGEGSCGNITINGGTIIAQGGANASYGAAGIGCSYGDWQYFSTCGDITISGGNVTAIGGSDAAGIGSTWFATCGNISITGGTVMATGGESGAGIGGGSGSYQYPSSCGKITITGGTVTAQGGNEAPGIGSGRLCNWGDIIINGGQITAYKGLNAPYSIGKSSSIGYTNGTVTIGGTQYYDGTNFLNGGDTYLATSPLTYQP